MSKRESYEAERMRVTQVARINAGSCPAAHTSHGERRRVSSETRRDVVRRTTRDRPAEKAAAAAQWTGPPSAHLCP